MKQCCHCKNYKQKSEFNQWLKAKDELQNRCRECQRAYQKELYHKSADRRKRIRECDNKRRAKLSQQINEYKTKKGCADCGITDARVLDFDHLRDKKFNISYGRGYFSWEKLLIEIEKCEVVCANCHRIRTFLRRLNGS